MKKSLTVVICVISFFAFGQKTKEVTKKYKNPWYTEKYSVLKSDKTVKHGNFQKLGYEDCLVINGYYNHGKKDSIWTTYYWRSKQIEKEGRYKDGKRVGEWRFYSQNGTLIQTYDYSLSKLTYSIKPEKETEIKIGDSIYSKILLSNPQYIGSTIELYDFIGEAQMQMSRDNEIQMQSGLVKISFYIDEKGVAQNHRLEEGISKELDEKCMEIAKSIPDYWIPGMDENGLVTSKYFVYMKFNYQRR